MFIFRQVELRVKHIHGGMFPQFIHISSLHKKDELHVCAEQYFKVNK